MHLPSLQADTVVHTINGDVPRGGDADAIIVDVDAEGDTAGDLLVSFDATSLQFIQTKIMPEKIE